MEKDFLVGLEYLGVTARVRRLGELFLYGIKELYLYADIDIEPSWHLVFLKLEEDSEISMFELSQSLNISKAAMTKMIKRMEKSGYIEVVLSTADSRKKTLKLTEKSKRRLPKFKKVWEVGQLAVQELLEDNEYFLEALRKIERKNAQSSFSERAMRIYEND